MATIIPTGLLLFTSVIFGLCSCSASQFPLLPRGEFDLDPNGAYHVQWDINFVTQTVTFDVTARTTGFVGFGISNGGGMLGADVVIGGVHTNGTVYFDDYHALGTFQPVRDEIQNYELHEASENSTHTHLVFSRLIDTGDTDGDTPITNATTNFIWSYGPTDRLLYHGPNRGAQYVNILL